MRPSPLVAILVLGCAGATIQLSPSNAPTPAPSVHDADALVSLSTGCFMGPRFGAPADPRMLARDRCTDVLLRAWGTADAGHRARLQSLDPDEVNALRGRLVDFGANRSQLTAFDRIARARREAVLVRRGAVIDALGPPSDATPEPSDATLALFAANLGDVTLEAELRTIALMSALERMDAVESMPRAIKTEALAGLFHAFYGVERPNSTSAMDWLAYLEAISAELGNVPAAGDPDERETAAWAIVRAAIGRDIAAAAESLPDSDLRRTAMAAAAGVGVKRSARAPLVEDVDRDAHAIVLHAATCWLDVRVDSRACATLAHVIHDDPALAFEAEESMRFARLDAIEQIAGAVRAAGGSSVDRDVALMRTTGTVAREAQRVRWATAALSADEEQPGCVRTLGESTNLVAMLGARNASSDARAIGLVFAADRLWTAQRGLPEELELRVADPVLATLTGDAIATSFERTARATGRRIPYSHSEDFDDVHVSLARASVGEAIADRLRVLPIAAPLSDVTRSVVLRLDIEYRAALAHYEP